MTQTGPAEQLAARLLYLTQQEKAVQQEKEQIKEALESLYGENAIPAKEDMQVLFSDGTFHKVRLRRQKTGTYFKVAEDHKQEYASDLHRLQARFLKDGRAEIAEKSCTWVAQEVKG